MDSQVPLTGSTSLLPFHSNPDILDEICEYLFYYQDQDFEETATGRHNLLHVALTCKAFLEPALDRIWRRLDSLFPLLKILPSFIQSDGTYVLRGIVSQEEWSRFDWYARRVRKFTYTRDPDSLDVAMHVYFRIAQLRTTPLLPSLRHLHCPAISQQDFLISGICLFLSSFLQTLEFEQISNVEDKLCGTVLHTLYSDCAPMEKIVLRGRGLSTDTLNMVLRFDHLRALDLNGMGDVLSMDLLEKIGSFPSLTELALDFMESSIPPLEKDIGLKDLKCLMITAPIPFIQAFLPHIATTTLHTFVAEAPMHPPVDKKDFLSEVVTRWKETLRRVDLVYQSHVTDGLEVFEELSVAGLEPLMSLRQLTHVRLEGYAMNLTDKDIRDFTVAWPNIITLSLPYIRLDRQRPTISSLEVVARYCPELRHLRMPLDTTEIIPFLPPSVSHWPAHGLRDLTIASDDESLDWKDVLHLGRHIDYLFPRLRRVNPCEGHDFERWMQLHETIRIYQSVRQQTVEFEHTRMQTMEEQARQE